ncbi:hypothetical protein WCE55_02190 [Luteimonas sp. MJ293]|uniref:DUF7210 family protein n=1 Tax=Luteimonas sp. MJ146 TaxID=3129240 RepID=UPI0031BA4170
MKVRIYQPHTHAGKRYTPDAEGIEIEVSKTDAAFLKQAGVTVPTTAKRGTKDEPDTGATTTQPAAAGKQ